MMEKILDANPGLLPVFVRTIELRERQYLFRCRALSIATPGAGLRLAEVLPVLAEKTGAPSEADVDVRDAAGRRCGPWDVLDQAVEYAVTVGS
jgi:hypothetical protein